MTLKEMICHRKSCRSFTGKPVDAEMIEKILSFELKPLYPDIKVRMDIVSRDKVKCICPWTTPQVIAVYSEITDGYLENVGFMFQQTARYVADYGPDVTPEEREAIDALLPYDELPELYDERDDDELRDELLR